jgi:hypothetical protein
MRLKATIITLLAIFQLLITNAKPIELNQAERVAKNFLFITINKYDAGCSFNDISLSDPYTYLLEGKPVFYAFQANPGFIIIAADDAFVPVIGYSFEGAFSMEGAPEHYMSFLMGYVRQISYLQENQLEPDAEVAAIWTELEQPGIPGLSITRERDVAPLLSCKWDQGSPYNIYCPADAAGPGGHVWVGCVATAMAQIMYYWRFPATGTGQHCYNAGSYGQQCAYYSQTNYDWTSMANSIDNRNPYANAELQYQIAVSVNMGFSPNGSGAYSSDVPAALSQHFKYNNAVYEEKQDFSLANWISLLKADIDLGKPLYYSGYTVDWSGHAFVCDGYQGDNFHFNFGWSGSSNGFYTLYDVAGFNQYQACVRNFAPTDVNYPYYCSGTKHLTSRSGSITDGSGPVENYLDNTTAYWFIDPQTIDDSISSITLKFSAFDLQAGDSVKVYNGGTTSDPLLGTYSGTTMPPSLTSSANRMLIEFKSNGSGNSHGWYAEYSSVTPSFCQGLTQLTDPSGTFTDGSGSFNYQSSSICLWRIQPPFANKITLNFNYFNTEQGVDKFSVYDGTTLIATFSGTEIPDQVEATSGSMFITWSTNSSNNFQGWEAYYEVDNVGIHEISSVTDLEVYPNPASDKIHLSFGVEEKGKLMIRLTNITGQVVYSEDLNSFSGIYQHDLPVGYLPSGYYTLEIITVSGTTNKKILVN